MARKNKIHDDLYAKDALHPSWDGNKMLEAKLRNIFNLMHKGMYSSFIMCVPLLVYWEFTSHLLENADRYAAISIEDEKEDEP